MNETILQQLDKLAAEVQRLRQQIEPHATELPRPFLVGDVVEIEHGKRGVVTYDDMSPLPFFVTYLDAAPVDSRQSDYATPGEWCHPRELTLIARPTLPQK